MRKEMYMIIMIKHPDLAATKKMRWQSTLSSKKPVRENSKLCVGDVK